jgi:hypothetical protein
VTVGLEEDDAPARAAEIAAHTPPGFPP